MYTSVSKGALRDSTTNNKPYLLQYQDATQLEYTIHLSYATSLSFLPLPAGRSFLVANAAADTHHIIFCSDGFCKMTGYTRAEVMQRSACTEFLHGPMTAQSAVAAVKEALIKGLEKHFEILYYRKTGE